MEMYLLILSDSNWIQNKLSQIQEYCKTIRNLQIFFDEVGEPI